MDGAFCYMILLKNSPKMLILIGIKRGAKHEKNNEFNGDRCHVDRNSRWLSGYLGGGVGANAKGGNSSSTTSSAVGAGIGSVVGKAIFGGDGGAAVGGAIGGGAGAAIQEKK